MNKEKRKMYGIKKWKRKGFSYSEIGQKIRRFKGVSFNTRSSVSGKIGWFKYLINIIKKFYVKHFQKEKSKT